MVFIYFVRKDNKEAKSKKAAQYIKAVKARVQILISPHIKTLCIKFDQTVFKDEYGNIVFTLWKKAEDYFIDNVLKKDDLIASYLNVSIPNNPINERYERSMRRINVGSMITDAIFANKKSPSSNSLMSVDVESLDPIQFEHHCSDILTNHGWASRATKGSGDQGIDIIATYNGVKAVFQCKKHSQPVGNGAVQEIIAGKVFEQAHIAAVVSNATFTPSAKQLASTAGIHLLHFSELPKFAERLGLVGV